MSRMRSRRGDAARRGADLVAFALLPGVDSIGPDVPTSTIADLRHRADRQGGLA